MPCVGQPEQPAAELDGRAQRRDVERRPAFLDEDPVDQLERGRRRPDVVDGGAEERPGERHEEGRRDALAGHVGDAQREPARPAAHPERVEEVAADLARRLVMVGELVALDHRRHDRDEAALDAPPEGQLGVEAGRRGRGLGLQGAGADDATRAPAAAATAADDRLEQRPVGLAATDDVADDLVAGDDPLANVASPRRTGRPCPRPRCAALPGPRS